MAITGVVLFGTGSPLLGDIEESLRRAGIPVAAGVRNRPEASHLSPDTVSWRPEELPAAYLDLPFMVPIFTPAYRQAAAREAAALGLHRPQTLVDPSVAAPRRLDLGAGTYINTGCSLGAAGTFGRFVLVNRGASIGHHVRLGAFVSIGPGATLAGQVTIGTGGVIGAGATILPGIAIGCNAVVGAGSVVTRDVPAACLVTGNPARLAREDIGGYRGVVVV
jgi:sugar O-acyltransferase (sialic acid O-acetyltransferase NeuD family)